MLEKLWFVNKKTSIFFNELAHKYSMKPFLGVFADIPIFFIPSFLVWAWIYWTIKTRQDKKEDLIYMFFSTVVAIWINLFIQLLVDVDRPETIVKPLLYHLPDDSFPSDHAAVSFAFLTSLYLFGYKKVFWIYLPFVVLMILSRVMWWIHWFFDVLVWAFIWIFAAFFVKKFLSKVSFVQKIAKFLLKVAKIFKL